MQHSRLFSETTIRSWKQHCGVIYFSVTSNGRTGLQWIEHFEEAGHELSDWAKSVLESKDFVSTDGVTYEIAILNGKIWSDTRHRTIRSIRILAKDLNLITPNVEVACLIREKFSINDLEQMGICWIAIMHKPIADSVDEPDLLCVFTDDNDEMFIGTICDYPHAQCPRGGGFAFVKSTSWA